MAATACSSPELQAAAERILRELIEAPDDDRPTPPTAEQPAPRPWPVVVTL